MKTAHCKLHRGLLLLPAPQQRPLITGGAQCRGGPVPTACLPPFLVLLFLLGSSPSSCIFSGTPAFPPASTGPPGITLPSGPESGDHPKPHVQWCLLSRCRDSGQVYCAAFNVAAQGPRGSSIIRCRQGEGWSTCGLWASGRLGLGCLSQRDARRRCPVVTAVREYRGGSGWGPPHGKRWMRCRMSGGRPSPHSVAWSIQAGASLAACTGHFPSQRQPACFSNVCLG